jgi:lipopolysaccharide export system protein LptC
VDIEPLIPPVPLADDPPPVRRQMSVSAVLATYLPLMLMAFLALGTWWLVKNSPVPGEGGTVAPPKHEPDYEMQRFAVQRFTPQGVLRAHIEGDAMRHYPDTDTLEIDNVRLRAVGADGGITRAVARRAIANADGSEVQLVGGAEVVREAIGDEEAVNFRGEFLHAFLDTERVRSHLPVTVTRGATEVKAQNMEYTHLDRVLRFGGRMQTVFSPRQPP